MNSDSSGKINYWPGFVDAFSNLVLALVFVIVILAMSLGMFSGLMAKMAIQRALIDQQLKESKAAGIGSHVSASSADTASSSAVTDGNGNEDGDAAPALETNPDSTQAAPAEPAGNADAAPAGPANSASDSTAPQPPSEGTQAPPPHDAMAVQAPEALPQDDRPLRSEAESAAARAAATEPVTLRHENDALRQEIAALRKKNAALIQAGTPIGADVKPAPSSDPKSDNKFGPTMPEGDHHFNQRIEDDLQRALKEFEALRDSRANINVVIHVPNYALTENKRTALFYLISIKDYLMKRKVSSERIRMHMTPAPAGQKDMSVSMSVEP